VWRDEDISWQAHILLGFYIIYILADRGLAPRWVAFMEFFLASRAKKEVRLDDLSVSEPRYVHLMGLYIYIYIYIKYI
jgi:hypothetical protein